ncbi:uncharacterized protein [Montipora capricornis]|uniref:uncharacterized protein n=1 Tax=Montipora capricornis TaxID=246305 RepID=UPI0035F13F01
MLNDQQVTMLPAFLLLSATFLKATSSASLSSVDGYCVHEGQKFYLGKEVVLQDCKYVCRCVANQGYSFFMCEPLCKAHYDVMCANGEEPVLEMEDSSVPQCKCPRNRCPERQSVAHSINNGTDSGYFEPDWDVEMEKY